MITDRSGKTKTALLMLVISLVIFTGCTRKHNLTGNNWSDSRPLVTTDTTFTMGYSYGYESKVTGSESRIICGTENGIEAMAMLQFIELPDSISVVGQPTLKLIATRRSLARRSPLILSFYRINQVWSADSTALITDADLSPLPIANFTVQDTLGSNADTLTVANITIPIPNAVIEDIANGVGVDTLGMGIAIKVVNPGWLEFKSNETARGATLAFTYRNSGETTDNEYSKHPSLDSYRITGTQADLADDVWGIRNLLPQRMYFKFNLPQHIFVDSTGTQMSAQDIKRMTINKAELVLYPKNNPYYTSYLADGILKWHLSSFYPYNVTRDTLTTPVKLTDSDLEMITNTLSTTPASLIDTVGVRIDITAIMQGITSGDIENNGVVVKSLQEMKNYGNLEFWHYTDAPAGKKPYVKITYTPPYLKSR